MAEKNCSTGAHTGKHSYEEPCNSCGNQHVHFDRWEACPTTKKSIGTLILEGFRIGDVNDFTFVPERTTAGEEPAAPTERSCYNCAHYNASFSVEGDAKEPCASCIGSDGGIHWEPNVAQTTQSATEPKGDSAKPQKTIVDVGYISAAFVLFAMLDDLGKARGKALEPTTQVETAAPQKSASARDTQVGGSHYKDMKIQPMDFSMLNGLDACQHTIIKYVARFRAKNGIEDLQKAKHVIDMLIEYEQQKAANK